MTDHGETSTTIRQRPTVAHPFVSDTAIELLAARPDGGWVELDGSLAKYDVSGFTTLAERLARAGRQGAEHINDVLTTTFDRLIEIAMSFGGDVLEFGGDAMVVLFTGEHHERRAVAASQRMVRSVDRGGPVSTEGGDARVRISCGVAAGTQPYHVVGTTRRAMVLAGPVSTEMVRLQGVARPGRVVVDHRVAAAVPAAWSSPSDDGATYLVRPTAATTAEPVARAAGRRVCPDDRFLQLLPTELRDLAGPHGAGELKHVGVGFIRTDGLHSIWKEGGSVAVHARLRAITDVVDATTAELGVCWLETQTEFDGVRWTVIAGAPDATERDGERLLLALRRIARRSPVPLHIGANFGVVYAGQMGHASRSTFIVMGDATNVAARLMARAAAGEIIAGDELCRSCEGRFEVTPIEPFLVKGRRALVHSMLVGEESELDEAGSSGSVAPMLGRQLDLERLSRAVVDRATVDVVGDAGSGKSRLWQEARAADRSRRWLVVRGEAHETRAPYGAIRRAIDRACGLQRGASPTDRSEALMRLIGAHARWLAPWAPLLGDLLGCPVGSTAEVDGLDPVFRADRLDAVAGELLIGIVAPDGVIVVDDLHWLDQSSLDVVEGLCRWVDRPVAVLTTRRSGTAAPPGGVTIELGPLDAASAERLLLDRLPERAASDTTVAALLSSAGGNPLYLHELATAVATSVVQAPTRRVDPTRDLPGSIERLLAARIDALPRSGRALVRDASALGSTFDATFARTVLDRPDLSDALTWQVELGDLISIDGANVRFRHDLVRLVAYEGLSMRRRRAVHRRAVEVLEAVADTQRSSDVVAALAFHAAGSGIDAPVIRWGSAAAQLAIDAGAADIAVRLLDDVIAAERRSSTPAPVRCATLRRRAVAAERAGHPEAALEALREASRLTSGNERAAIAVDRARLLEKLGRYSTALATTTRALSACTDPAVTARLLLSRATLWNFQGRWRDCLALCERMLDGDARLDDARLVAQAHLLAEWCCTALGHAERAAHAAEAFEMLTDLDDSVGLANLLLNRGESAWRSNRPDDAVADFRASSEHYLRAGDVVGAALADNNLAELLTLQFRLDPAEALLQHARRVTQAANYPHGTFATISGLSRIAAWRGMTDAALGLQTEALAGFRELGSDDFVADGLVRMVEIHVIAGDDRALAAADVAGAALVRLGDVQLLGATLNRLRGRALVAAGRDAAAREMFELALEHALADGFEYEVALARLGLARLDGDDEAVADVMRCLARLGVLAPPPGS